MNTMTNETPNPEAQPVSQKYAAMNKFTNARNNDVVYAPHWETLQAVKIELIADPEERRQACHTAYNSMSGHDVFVRACPLAPRPGVLESSRALEISEVITIVDRITMTMLGPDPDPANPMYEHGLCDPDGCIMLMPYLDATASCVVAPYSYVSVGEGNAGVTSPHEGGFQVVMDLSQSDENSTRTALGNIGIDPAKIELEFVHRVHDGNLNARIRSSTKKSTHWGNTRIVQLRGADAGHKPIRSPPHPFEISGFVQGGTVTVKEVLTLVDGSDEELARLEEYLRGRDLDGVVVAHPDGSPLSHHAGQCTKWGVTYINSDKPKVGDTWIEVDGWVIDDPTIEPQPFHQYHWRESFDRGLAVGMTKFSRQYGWLSNHFHQFLGGAVMKSPQDTAYLAGVFAGYLPNAILSVSFGEMRYMNRIKNNTLPINSMTFMALSNGVSVESVMSQDRRSYYRKMEEQTLTINSLLGQLEWCAKMYDTGWEGTGYGGKDTYGRATNKGVAIVEGIIKYGDDPSEDNFVALLGLVNEGENIVHNNGFFLDKFISKRAFDIGTNPKALSAFIPSDFFAVYGAASHAHQYINGFQSVDKIDTTSITDFALNSKGANNFHKQLERPIMGVEDSPFTEFNQPKYIAMIHGSQSKYGGGDHEKFVPCGSLHCEKCKQVALDKMTEEAQAMIQLPLPSNQPQYDMKLPLDIEVSYDLPEYIEEHSGLLLTIFKGHAYIEHVIPNIIYFLNEAHEHNLQDNGSKLAKQLVKHYAAYIHNAPLDFKIKLMQTYTGEEE
jgi:hypothetical protein